MPWFCQFETASGRIKQRMEIPVNEADFYAADGISVLLCVVPPDLYEHYVDTVSGVSTVLPRPLLPAFDKTAIAADDVDTATLAGLPVPCDVRIDGVVHSVTDGVLEFTAAYPGTYRIEIRHFPYRDFTAEITAT